MWEKVKVIWKIPELRSKIGLTLLMLAIYRVGFQIQVPILDQAKVNSLSQQKGGVGDMLESVALLSASRLRDVTIFGLGIMPIIRPPFFSRFWRACIHRSNSCRRRAKLVERKSTSTLATQRSSSVYSKVGSTYSRTSSPRV